MKRILALAYGGGHTRMIIPVVKELSRRGHQVTFMALTAGAVHAKSAGLDYCAYQDFLHLVDKEKVDGEGRRLADAFHSADSPVSYEESVAYLGVNWLENVDHYGEEKAERLYRLIGRHSFFPVNFMEKVILETKADLILTTNSPKSERAAVVACQRCDIPSTTIEDLFLEDNLCLEIKQLMGDDYIGFLGGYNSPIHPTRIFVMSRYTKRLFPEKAPILKIRTSIKNVIVTGQPIFDELDVLLEGKKGGTKPPQWGDKPVITWAQQCGMPDELEALNILKQWQQSPESQLWNFVIKVHPNASHSNMEHILSHFDLECKNVIVIYSEMDPVDVLYHSELVISQSSTMLIQAAYLKKPLFIMDPTDIRKDSPYVKSGIGSYIKTSSELTKRLKDTTAWRIQSRQCQRGIEKVGFGRKGTKNIADQIEIILNV